MYLDQIRYAWLVRFAQDWELTSAREARSETSDMEAQQVISGALPTARELVAAFQTNLDLRDEHSGILRGSTLAADSTTVAAANADAVVSEAPNTPMSISTTIINEIVESIVHKPAPMQQWQPQPMQQQQPQPQQHPPENTAHVKYLDMQIAEGNLIMRPGRKIEYMNIMTFGESGLGKTVRPWWSLDLF
jgi:hypothetical protein